LTNYFFGLADQQPWTYAGAVGQEFNEPGDETLSKRQREILEE